MSTDPYSPRRDPTLEPELDVTPIADDFLPMHPRDYLILFALVDGAVHGYGIVKAVEAESGGAVRMDPANLYRSLKRLERDGLVTEVDGPAQDESGGAERRRFYALTPTGRRAVSAEAARLAALARSAAAKDLIGRSEAL
jgi:DNA-binding PadR family transcriptional regulator